MISEFHCVLGSIRCSVKENKWYILPLQYPLGIKAIVNANTSNFIEITIVLIEIWMEPESTKS